MRRSSRVGATDGVAPAVETLSARLDALGDLPTPELQAIWRQTKGAPPPKGARRRLLMLGIAWQWQAERHGGFRPEMARRLTALEDRAARTEPLDNAEIAKAARPVPGTRLVRIWRGERHEVHVTERGYLWRGRSFGSLSGAARAITGANRNGPRFFGLREARRSS